MVDEDLEDEVKYRLFDQVVQLRLYQSPGRQLFFFTMHDNETTAVRTGRTVIEEHGGMLLELTHGGTRNISFRADGQTYRFDPNRMFSDRGARASLKDASEAAQVPMRILNSVRQFAEFVVDQYGFCNREKVCTLHNVTDDLSVHSYSEGGLFEQNAARVEHGYRGTGADFFLVTDRRLGKKLAERGWNVVVQDDQRVEEDGSLSVRARDMDVPYFNVEARQGHVNVQRKMINDLYHVTDELSG